MVADDFAEIMPEASFCGIVFESDIFRNVVRVELPDDVFPEDFCHDLLNELFFFCVIESAVVSAEIDEGFICGIEIAP